MIDLTFEDDEDDGEAIVTQELVPSSPDDTKEHVSAINELGNASKYLLRYVHNG